MRILLTGATGFIGNAFARIALQRGSSIAGLSRQHKPIAAKNKSSEKSLTLQGNLESPPWKEIEAFSPEVCIHSAWITTPGIYLNSNENPLWEKWSASFIDGMLQRGCKRIVALGTCIEYEPPSNNIDLKTTDPLASNGPAYVQAKQNLHNSITSICEKSNAHLAWARVFYPYGPGEHPNRLCSQLINKFQRGEELILKTPESTKDYVYIDDIAEAIYTLAENKFNGIANIATNKGISILSMAQKIEEICGQRNLVKTATETVHDPYPYIVGDNTELKRLGWLPKVDITTGLRHLIESL